MKDILIETVYSEMGLREGFTDPFILHITAHPYYGNWDMKLRLADNVPMKIGYLRKITKLIKQSNHLEEIKKYFLTVLNAYLKAFEETQNGNKIAYHNIKLDLTSATEKYEKKKNPCYAFNYQKYSEKELLNNVKSIENRLRSVEKDIVFVQKQIELLRKNIAIVEEIK